MRSQAFTHRAPGILGSRPAPGDAEFWPPLHYLQLVDRVVAFTTLVRYVDARAAEARAAGRTMDEWDAWLRNKEMRKLDPATARQIFRLREWRFVLERIQDWPADAHPLVYLPAWEELRESKPLQLGPEPLTTSSRE